MPHKVNPSIFENAEGNFGVANALFENILPPKAAVSRLQRDLTDSTVLRNIGVPVPIPSCPSNPSKRLGQAGLNEKKLYDDLEGNWAVVAEAIQTILRRKTIPAPTRH